MKDVLRALFELLMSASLPNQILATGKSIGSLIIATAIALYSVIGAVKLLLTLVGVHR